MNADGIPSLWVQTVCVYSVSGLLESRAPAGSASKTRHTTAQKERATVLVWRSPLRIRVPDNTRREPSRNRGPFKVISSKPHVQLGAREAQPTRGARLVAIRIAHRLLDPAPLDGLEIFGHRGRCQTRMQQ